MFNRVFHIIFGLYVTEFLVNLILRMKLYGIVEEMRKINISLVEIMIQLLFMVKAQSQNSSHYIPLIQMNIRRN